jgi:HK97 gp10 family phage protein
MICCSTEIGSGRHCDTHWRGRNEAPVERAVGQNSENCAERGCFEGAKVLRDQVQNSAPVRTGNLKKNIIVYKDRHPQQMGAAVRYSVLVRRIKVARKVKRLLRSAAKQGVQINFADNAYYWRFLEFGTSKIQPTAFFRKSIDAVTPRLIKIVGDKLQAGIDRAAKQLGAK